MLTKIREKIQGVIATVILLLVVIPFALWGINSYFEGGSSVNVATADGVEISQRDYRAAMDQFRGRMDPAVFDSREFKALVVDGLIDQALLVRDARARGYRIGNERLGRLIREKPYFQRDGKFDPQLYEALLRREGMSTVEFEARLREENMTGQLQAAFGETAIVTEAEVTALLRLWRQEREVVYAVVDPERFAGKAVVTPKAIEEYYSARADAFRAPEEVRVEYLRLAAEDFVKKYQPSEDELRKAYAEEAARYTRPEKRRASHILIAVAANAAKEEVERAQGRIRELERQARAGADFAALAGKHSQDPDSAAKGGDLGEIGRGVLPKELEAAIYVLRPGAISQPVRTEFGFHLAKLTGFTPEARKPLHEARKELTDLVRKRRGEEHFLEEAEKFRNLVYEHPEGLGPAAQALGLAIQRSEWFGRAGGAGVAAYPKVVEAAFHPEVLGKTRNSDAVEINPETMVAVRVLDHRPAALRPLAEVRAQIERTLRLQQAGELARAAATDWLKQLQAGAALEALARSHALKYQGPRLVTRERLDGRDRRVVEAAFRAPRPQTGRAVYGLADLGSQGYAVFGLKRVLEGRPEKADSALRERARRLLLSRRGIEYYALYRAGLRQKVDIKIYQDRL